jgi:hypothetical protein
MSTQQAVQPRRRQFDLWALLEWTAAVAFIAALLAGSSGAASWTFDFAQLPADDLTLQRWLDEQGHRDVQVLRDGLSVKLRSEQSVWLFANPTFVNQLPQPPWPELGYLAPHAMRGATSWTLFSGSTYLWIVGFGVLLLLGHIRRRSLSAAAVRQAELPARDATA